MHINELNPHVQSHCRFARDQWLQVPKACGCYVLATFENHILYIGQSVDLQRRFEDHLNDPEKTNPTGKGRAFWFYWLEYPELQLNALERGWLNQYSLEHGFYPILNKQGAPI